MGFAPVSYVPQVSVDLVSLVLWHLLRPSRATEKRPDDVMVRAAA
jgi:hypothetical protein